jgi:hypothetical protein
MDGTSSWDEIMIARNLPKNNHARNAIAADADTYVMTKLISMYNEYMKYSGLAVYKNAHMVPIIPMAVPILNAHANILLIKLYNKDKRLWNKIKTQWKYS